MKREITENDLNHAIDVLRWVIFGQLVTLSVLAMAIYVFVKHEDYLAFVLLLVSSVCLNISCEFARRSVRWIVEGISA